MKIPITGFAPDLEPSAPGVLLDCNNVIPTTKGIYAAPSLAYAGIDTLAATPTSAYTTTLLDGTKRVFAATATKIYEASGTTWTDRSRAGNYSGSEPQSFTVFGNIVLSANRAEVIGQSSSGAGFTDIAGAPKAAILTAASGFVIAFNTSDATYGDRPDGWWCSGLRDQTTWAPSGATQAANGRLIDSPGAIRAAAPLGDYVVAYKETSMYLGRYVGPPIIWRWDRVPGDIGCAAKRAVVVYGTKHFFPGPDDFYVFDSTYPQPLNAPLRQWFAKDLNASYAQNIVGTADVQRGIIYWYYPSSASPSGALDTQISYNVATNAWAKRKLSVTTPILYVSGAATIDGLGASYATFDALPEIPFDSAFWLTGQSIQSVFKGTVLYTLTGAPTNAWVKTGAFGNEQAYSFLSRVSPTWRSSPTGASATNYYRDTLDGTETQDASISMMRNRFDFRRSARWHTLRIDWSGETGFDALDIVFSGESKE